jgi:hypothetical protein
MIQVDKKEYLRRRKLRNDRWPKGMSLVEWAVQVFSEESSDAKAS